MFFIDIRTLFVNYVVINIIGLLLISIPYAQIRKKFPKSVVIVISFAMSASGNILIFFQDVLPDWLSIVVGNTLVVSSTVVLLIGFEKFLNKKEKQIQNYILLFIFFVVHCYFTVVHPNLHMRSINIIFFQVLLSSQIAWLMLVKAPRELRKTTRNIGYIFCSVFVIECVRMVVIILRSKQFQNYYNLDDSEVLFLLSYQIVFITLAYTISLI